ncbi:MAG: rod shape-determining protein RodA [Anaerolineae bacterium]|nr:rod shape-determining protein RodA [Anaerolineae bacterium]
MSAARIWRQFDFALLIFIILLIVFGIVMIRSANLGTEEDLVDLWRAQTNFAIIGMALFFLAAALPYQWLKDVWWAGFLVALGLLVLVLFIGSSEVGDVRRWFFIGTFRLQPSYVAFLFFIISMAAILDYRSPRDHHVEGEKVGWGPPPKWWTYLLSGAVALLFAVLVFLEPDMSVAMTFVIIWAAMAFVSEVHIGYILATLAVGLASILPLWQVMEPYQRGRVLTFLNPERDPAALYNINQALISIGSGGFWGKGYGVGTQSQLHFLRVRHTDFIFSVIGEELGFLGTTILLGLFVLLGWRVFRAALMAPDRFGRLLVVGVGTLLFFQTLVNVGMNIGVLPVTGLPLPFVSYGGSGLWTALTALGLVAGVGMRRKQ